MSNLTKAAIWVFIINITSKILGLFRESILAYKFGTSYIVDAYAISITLPAILCTIFIKGLAESYIPIVSRIENEDKRRAFTNNIITIITIGSVFVSIFSIILRKPLLTILAPGFSDVSYDLAEEFVTIIIWVTPFLALFNIIAAYLSSLERFIALNFCDFILVNGLVIVSIGIASVNHLEVLAAGYVISQAIPLVILWVYTKIKTSFKYKPKFEIRQKEFLELAKLAVPLGASLMVNQINGIVDRMLASFIGEGIIAALSYANKIQLLFYSLTTAIFISLCYPRINQCFAKNRYNEGMKYVTKGILLTTWIGLPVSVVLLIFAEPVVVILFERGSFDSNSTIITAQCLAAYGIGILFYSYREILARALAANKKQKLIFKNTLISIMLNIIFSLIMVEKLEHIGLALATSIAGAVASFLMYRDVKRIGLRIISKEEKKDFLKIIGCVGITTLLCYSFYLFIQYFIGESLSFIITMLVGVLCYCLTSNILKIDIWYWTLDRVRRKK